MLFGFLRLAHLGEQDKQVFYFIFFLEFMIDLHFVKVHQSIENSFFVSFLNLFEQHTDNLQLRVLFIVDVNFDPIGHKQD